MTNDTDMTPGDLAGTVREVQHELRQRYGATEADIRGDDVTEWGREDPGPGESDTVSSEGRSLEFADGADELISRSQDLVVTLQWLQDDLPTEQGRTDIEAALEMLTVKIRQILDDYPEADVSTYTDGTRAQLNLNLGDA